MPKALASVDVQLIRKWEHRVYRWMEAYRAGKNAKDAQLQVRKYGSLQYKSHRRAPMRDPTEAGMISNCTISGSSCLIWQIGAQVANLPYHIFFNFLFIENHSGRSLSIIKRMYSTRGIRIWSEITCALLTIQLWWCLDHAHHRSRQSANI